MYTRSVWRKFSKYNEMRTIIISSIIDNRLHETIVCNTRVSLISRYRFSYRPSQLPTFFQSTAFFISYRGCTILFLWRQISHQFSFLATRILIFMNASTVARNPVTNFIFTQVLYIDASFKRQCRRAVCQTNFANRVLQLSLTVEKKNYKHEFYT